MAKKPTDKQLFKMKNEWLEQFYEEVKPRDFYRAVFPEGSFEREGHPEDEKCNGVLTVIECFLCCYMVCLVSKKKSTNRKVEKGD